jgi:hypothetical protein
MNVHNLILSMRPIILTSVSHFSPPRVRTRVQGAYRPHGFRMTTSSKDRPACSVEEHSCDYVLLGLEVLRRLWFQAWMGHPYRTMSGPT